MFLADTETMHVVSKNKTKKNTKHTWKRAHYWSAAGGGGAGVTVNSIKVEITKKIHFVSP